MSYSQLILRDSAEIVWPLDDINQSSSVSKSINFISNLDLAYSASININNTNVIGVPMIYGGGSLLSFTSSAVGLSIPAIGRFSELYNNKDSTISFWFQCNAVLNQEFPIFKKRGFSNIGLFIKNNYLIFRCGNNNTFNELRVELADPEEPHHIIVSRNSSGLMIILDGIPYIDNDNFVEKVDYDPIHSTNDFIDFYGPPEGSWNIDSPAFYPNILNPNIAKRHYVYGLGKNIPDKIFYSKGGNIYNISTIYTDRLSDINWTYSDDWNLTELINLNNDELGIGPIQSNSPVTYSYDNILDTSSNIYKFSSGSSVTQASYIDVNKLFNKINSLEYPFFVKLKLNGQLPDKYISQKLISIGEVSGKEIISFNLYNNNENYQVLISAINFSSSVSFNINNISSSPSFYVGVKFDGQTHLYFAEDGDQIQTASFNYLTASSFGLDPLTGYLPLSSDSVIRIGSSLNYNSDSFNSNSYVINQFFGSFERFLVVEKDFTSSSNFSYLESYRKSKYEFIYNTNLNRFKVKTYGRGSFNIHSINISEEIDDNNRILGSNYIKIGYPGLESSSLVYVYATLLSYSGSTAYPQNRLGQDNYLPYINNTNLSNKYLKFDFEIYSDDTLYYPPRIKYFKMQTFKSQNNLTSIKDDAGPSFKIYPSSSSAVYLPEMSYTPSIFMTDKSGLKVHNSLVEFTDNILSKPLDPTTIPGLKLWLDARFVNGLDRVNPFDDTRIKYWYDLSDSNNNALQNDINVSPVYRTQSLNLFRMNQLDGGELDDTQFITPFNSIISTSPEGAVSGTRGIKITPTGSSLDSYIDVSFNTASISVFPNQSYTVVGSIKLFKPQTASSLHTNARKIIISNIEGGQEIFTASSQASLNSAGTYSLSAVFFTSSATNTSIIKFYNGSNLASDVVYWDNLGLYPVNSGSYVTSWVLPLTVKDHATIKFNGSTIFMESSASVNTPNSLYIVARNFGDSIFLQSTTASILYSNSASYFISYGSAQNYSPSDNKFKLFSILNNGTSASVFINGDFIGSKNSGSLNIDKLFIGRQLKGDISAILVYEGINSTQDRERVERWLNESFPMYWSFLC